MKIGAFDYLLKPFKFENILPVIVRALNVHQLRMENVTIRDYVARLTFESKKHEFIGRSPSVQRVVQLIKKVAPSDSTVLIRGETGTGKELVARDSSSRRGDRQSLSDGTSARAGRFAAAPVQQRSRRQSNWGQPTLTLSVDREVSTGAAHRWCAWYCGVLKSS